MPCTEIKLLHNKEKEAFTMNLATIIAALAVIALVGFAVRTIVKSKKSGAKCIGCPESGSCCKK